MRWKLKLEEYDYNIIHKTDKSNTNADALNRNPIRSDECMHNVQSKDRKDDNKEDKETITKEYTEIVTIMFNNKYIMYPVGGYCYFNCN